MPTLSRRPRARSAARSALILGVGILATALLSEPARSTAGSTADSLDLAAYRGEVVYLDFWASWCKPCRDSFPWMNALHERLGPRGLVVVAVNVDRKRDAADKFLAEHPASFRVVFDPEGTLAETYALKAMPTSFVIDREGKVRETHTGFHQGKSAEWEKSLEALLAEGTHEPSK